MGRNRSTDKVPGAIPTFHPNAAGHRAIAGRIVDTIVDRLQRVLEVVEEIGRASCRERV